MVQARIAVIILCERLSSAANPYKVNADTRYPSHQLCMKIQVHVAHGGEQGILDNSRV